MPVNLKLFRKTIVFLALFFFCHAGIAQTLPELTTQERLNVSLSKNDTSRIRALNKLGTRHGSLFLIYKNKKNFDSAFLVLDKSLKIANALKRPDKNFWRTIVLVGIGQVEAYLRDSVTGRKKLHEAINYFAANHYHDEELNCWQILASNAKHYGNTKELMAFLKVLESRAKKYNNTDKLIRAKHSIIDAMASTTKPDKIPELYQSLIQEFKHTGSRELNLVYAETATYYRLAGNLSEALRYALAANDRMVKTNDTAISKKSVCFGELAEIYQLLGNHAQSIYWYKKTIAVRRQADFPQVSIYRTAGFLVQEYIKIGKANEALAYILRLAKEFPPLGGDNEANLFQMKGYCYEALGRIKLAENAYLMMIDRYRAFKPQEAIMSVANYDISKFYVNQKQFKKASLYLSVRDLESGGAADVKDYHYLLYKIDSASKNYLSAIRHLNTYKNMSDSIFNLAKSRQIAEIDVKYATAQREKDIKALKRDQLLQKENIKQASIIRNWILLGVALLLVTIGLLYNSFRVNRRKSREIDHQNDSLNSLIAEKDELLQEKEWLIKEVHHRVKNNLQIISSLLHSQSNYINNEDALLAMQNSENRVHAIALIHQKLYQSENLELINMPTYIEEMIGYLRGSYELDNRITFEKHLEQINLYVAQAVTLGLILNEAITNAIKYAYCSDEVGTVYIAMVNSNDKFYQLTIADNGPGFPVGFDFDKVDSLGLNLIRGLCKQLGGSLTFSSEQGCMISITFKNDFQSSGQLVK